MKIDSKNAFVHVVYEYRCLVRAQQLCNKSHEVDTIIKESGTIGRNAVLLKLRSLMKFYEDEGGERTDIRANNYFGFSLQNKDFPLYQKIRNVLNSIEVNEIHLTIWRDESYRSKNSASKGGSTRFRVDWDKEQSSIVDDLLKVLSVWSKDNTQWANPTELLCNTCKSILDKGGDWEPKLAGESEILSYLTELGL